MQTTIHHSESPSSHDSYCEYVIDVEYGLTSHGSLINWFKVVDVESIVLYPCHSDYGYDVKLVHESLTAKQDLIDRCEKMLRESERETCEEILRSHYSQLAAA